MDVKGSPSMPIKTFILKGVEEKPQLATNVWRLNTVNDLL